MITPLILGQLRISEVQVLCLCGKGEKVVALSDCGGEYGFEEALFSQSLGDFTQRCVVVHFPPTVLTQLTLTDVSGSEQLVETRDEDQIAM